MLNVVRWMGVVWVSRLVGRLVRYVVMVVVLVVDGKVCSGVFVVCWC